MYVMYVPFQVKLKQHMYTVSVFPNLLNTNKPEARRLVN